MAEISELCADSLSEPGIAFVKDIESVCRKHGIQLTVSLYDAFQIWPLKDGDPCMYAAGIEDMTSLQ